MSPSRIAGDAAGSQGRKRHPRIWRQPRAVAAPLAGSSYVVDALDKRMERLEVGMAEVAL